MAHMGLACPGDRTCHWRRHRHSYLQKECTEPDSTDRGEARLQLEATRSEQKDLILRATDEALRLRTEAEALIREALAALA